MLSVHNLSVGYKGLLAIQDVSFEVKRGEVVSLIGSNGAGKTTLLKTIMGLLKPMQGEIRLHDQVISGQPAYEVVRKKISLVPEGRRLFPRLSVWDNLLLGAYTVNSKEQIAESLETVLRLFPWLEERAGQRAGTLSGGEQQQVAIARGLMSRPELLMLDEPSMGVMPKLVTEYLPYRGTYRGRGRHRAPGRTECVRGLAGLPPGLRLADWPHRHGGPWPRALAMRPGAPGLPGDVIGGEVPRFST